MQDELRKAREAADEAEMRAASIRAARMASGKLVVKKGNGLSDRLTPIVST